MNKCQLISELSREGYRQKQQKQKAILQLLTLSHFTMLMLSCGLGISGLKFIVTTQTCKIMWPIWYIYQLLVKKLSKFLYIFIIKNIYWSDSNYITWYNKSKKQSSRNVLILKANHVTVRTIHTKRQKIAQVCSINQE